MKFRDKSVAGYAEGIASASAGLTECWAKRASGREPPRPMPNVALVREGNLAPGRIANSAGINLQSRNRCPCQNTQSSLRMCGKPAAWL
jgi:hypothetical protein